MEKSHLQHDAKGQYYSICFQTITPEKTQEILQHLSNRDATIECFQIRACEISNLDFSEILRRIKNSGVKRLFIHSQNLNEFICRNIVETLQSPALIELKLEKIILPIIGFGLIFTAIRFSALNSLVIEDCEIPNETLRTLFENINHNQLHDLDLSKNKLGNESIAWLFQSTNWSLSSLNVLRLSQCFLFDEALQTLGLILIQNPNIQELDISMNTFTSVGMEYLKQSFINGCKLEHLYVSDCELDDHAITVLSEGLINSKFLKSLFLDSNEFSDACTLQLHLTVKQILSLEILYLAGNFGLTDECFGNILKCAKNHPRLSVVSIEETNISDNLKHELDLILEKQQRLLTKIFVLICAIDILPSYSVSSPLKILNLNILKRIAHNFFM